FRLGRARSGVRVLRQTAATVRTNRGAGRGRPLLIQRVITGAIFGIVVIAAVLSLPTAGAAAVLALLFIAGAWEWAGLARFSAPSRAVYAGAFTGLVVTGFWWSHERAIVTTLLVISMLGWLVALFAVLTYPRRLRLGA